MTYAIMKISKSQVLVKDNVRQRAHVKMGKKHQFYTNANQSKYK